MSTDEADKICKKLERLNADVRDLYDKISDMAVRCPANEGRIERNETDVRELLKWRIGLMGTMIVTLISAVTALVVALMSAGCA